MIHSIGVVIAFFGVLYSILAVIFGTGFYRISFSIFTFSELYIVFSMLIVFFKFKDIYIGFVYLKSIVFLLFLSLIYFVYSIFFSHPIYFAVRQFIFVIYVFMLPVFCYAISKALSAWGTEGFKRWVWVSLLASAFSLFLVQGNRDGVVLIAVLVSACYYYSGGVGVFPLFSVLVAGAISGHAGHLVASLAFVGSFYLFKKPSLFVIVTPFLLAGAVLVIPTLLGSDALTDANASWRYNYWSDVFELVFSNGYGFFGEGFGIEYINPDLTHYWDIIGQISNQKYDDVYRSYTTPTHNSFLNVFYHIGGVGVFLMFYLLFKPLWIAFRRLDGVSVGVFFVIFLHMMSHNAIELPYMAIPLFLCWSLLILATRKSDENFSCS
ncbi:hypothetical protein [Oceanobacter mangrovi]|uniref:hypothetical protein n=1 Tax=Oceanobacter mangrovi TaxID=2862510 RepID=UPI001C8D985F|nr:hypothetical protein [Oceanobacter mangrovi]